MKCCALLVEISFFQDQKFNVFSPIKSQLPDSISSNYITIQTKLKKRL